MANDKRKLTEKELKRKNDFEKLSSEMQQMWLSIVTIQQYFYVK